MKGRLGWWGRCFSNRAGKEQRELKARAFGKRAKKRGKKSRAVGEDEGDDDVDVVVGKIQTLCFGVRRTEVSVCCCCCCWVGKCGGCFLAVAFCCLFFVLVFALFRACGQDRWCGDALGGGK